MISAPLLVALLGCKDPVPAWAVQHGTAVVGTEALGGYQVWEFYGEGWGRNKSADQHVCARVQALEGIPQAFAGCEDCEGSWAVRTEEVETDCAGTEAHEAAYAGVRGYAFGPVPSEMAGDDPHEGFSYGWYLSWDGENLEPFGYAWDEALETNEEPATDTIEPGKRLVLWPAFAWEL
jgi:hypothetical protein